MTTNTLRGFGLDIDLERGGLRTWYAGDDGIRRWTANDKPVDTPTPDAPEPMDSEGDTK